MEDEQIIEPTDIAVIYQQDKAIIDMQIATAKAYPRSITRAVENAITVATLDKETAQTCHYSLPRGGKKISGPSVHLAKIIAQSWGNLRAESKVIDIGPKHITCQGICFDLENNVAMKVEIKRSIMTKNGRMNDDMITVTGNAGNAIALRNAIFATIPKNVTDKVYAAAKQAITGDLSTENKLIAQRKKLLDSFDESYGVSEEEVLRAIGKQSVKHITADDIVDLIGLGQAIKDGDTTVEDTFRSRMQKETVSAEEKEAIRVKEFIAKVMTVDDLHGADEYVMTLAKDHEIRVMYDEKLAVLEGV